MLFTTQSNCLGLFFTNLNLFQTLLNCDQMLDRDSGVYSVGFDTSSESGFSEEYPGDGERGRLGRGRSGRARAIRVVEPEDVLQGLS